MLICFKLIITSPSVALVAALLAGGALLAHVDPYGEVCQLSFVIICHYLSSFDQFLSSFDYYLS